MKRTGFTLVDLLVVIFILTLLGFCAFPALNQAREVARQMQCGNNLKRQALATLNYESTMKSFPSGGWNVDFVGDPDRGFGKRQPGTWTFSLLPFSEQNSLFLMGGNEDPQSETPKATTEVLTTPLAYFICPSRREYKTFPLKVTKYLNSDFNGSEGSKSDYAACYGSTSMDFRATGCLLTGDPEEILTSEVPNGLIYDASEVKLDDVVDGLSNTYLIGEKFVCSDQYEAAGDGDQASMYAGVCGDARNSNFRSAGTYENAAAPVAYLPTQDAPSAQFAGTGIPYQSFGSPHEGTFGMAMGDGSVQRVSYQIDAQAHANLANRKDETRTVLPE